jgi:hypothetical protein
MKKVQVLPHTEYEKDLAKDRLAAPSKCEVTARGQTFTVERLHRRGTRGTEAEPTDDTLIEKFRHNAERILTQAKIDRAVDAFMELEKLPDLSHLIEQLTV